MTLRLPYYVKYTRKTHAYVTALEDIYRKQLLPLLCARITTPVQYSTGETVNMIKDEGFGNASDRARKSNAGGANESA